MNVPEDSERRQELHDALDALRARGWITSWSVSSGGYDIAWTDKGRERRRWLRVIDSELGAGERAMTLVLALCCTPGLDES